MRVLGLTRYARRGASSRMRFEQFVPGLADAGIEVTLAPLLSDAYLERRYAGRGPDVLDVARSYVARAAGSHRGRYDLVWLEKESWPWIPDAIERALSRPTPFVVDLDDAWFHRYDQHPSPVVRALLGRKLDAVMHRASIVVAGNAYIADRARRAGARRVEILPTVVDSRRYATAVERAAGPFTIGWIGTPLTAGYLAAIEPALREAAAGGARLVAVGAGPLALDGIPVETPAWSEEDEAPAIARFDVGIMPLPDSPWERGKCAYKLIQYMASGKPVVASAVGVNREILADGAAGFLADDPVSWARALIALRDDRALRRRMGEAGRRLVEGSYDLRSALPRLAAILREGGAR